MGPQILPAQDVLLMIGKMVVRLHGELLTVGIENTGAGELRVNVELTYLRV